MTEKQLKKFNDILNSMIVDVSYITKQLAIHERECIKDNIPFGEDWLDVTRRVKTVLLEVASL